jgi:5'-deoxynucleotidase YfbR-like HD superfamily hydrolase
MAEYRLKDMPEDVKEILIKAQTEKKIEKKMLQYSIELTIYSIVREYDKLRTKQAF